MPGVMKLVVAESGFTGLFTGLVPRVCLGIWQTLFMVTGAKLVKECVPRYGYLAVAPFSVLTHAPPVPLPAAYST